MMKITKNIQIARLLSHNIATGEMSQAISPFHIFDYFITSLAFIKGYESTPPPIRAMSKVFDKIQGDQKRL